MTVAAPPAGSLAGSSLSILAFDTRQREQHQKAGSSRRKGEEGGSVGTARIDEQTRGATESAKSKGSVASCLSSAHLEKTGSAFTRRRLVNMGAHTRTHSKCARAATLPHPISPPRLDDVTTDGRPLRVRCCQGRPE